MTGPWGKLHTLAYNHVLGRVQPLDQLFNRGPYTLGGDFTTVWSTGISWHDLSSKEVIGLPFRFITDLGNLSNLLGLLAPGQSGQPGSQHYVSQVEAWFMGKYHPMVYTREDVEQEAQDKLRLEP
jgi:penicillin amidase